MTNEEVYKKMILEEIKPEQAKKLFQAEINKRLLVLNNTINDPSCKPLTEVEKMHNMMFFTNKGSERVEKRQYEDKKAAADIAVIYGYLKEAENMIKNNKQSTEKEKQDESSNQQNTVSTTTFSKDIDNTKKELPIDNNLEQLTKGDSPVLRKWVNGQYKCKNLRRFVNEYADLTGSNPTKNLIMDYIVKENGKPFTESTVIATINSYGVLQKGKIPPAKNGEVFSEFIKLQPVQRQGTHRAKHKFSSLS